MSIALQQILETSKVPQALLFVGGTKHDAINFAKQLLEEKHHHKIDLNNHPDIHCYEPEGKSHLHPLANIQKLIEEIALPPYEAPIQTFIIDQAEKMLPSSSNALLKTLEEPPKNTYFILLSDFPDQLLPTVTSRLRPILFSAKGVNSFDMSPYFDLAEKGEWDILLDKLDALESEDPQSIFKGCLETAAKTQNPTQFLKMSKLITEGQKALNHHVKLRQVLLNIFLRVE